LKLAGRNNRANCKLIFASLLIAILAISSCNPTKYVPENQSLLYENRINMNKDYIKKSTLEPYIKQQPNKRIFGTRFYLGLYNLSNINKSTGFHEWLRRIGEAPVIFDPSSAKQSSEQIRSFVASKGYFDGQVIDSVNTEDRKTRVFYNVDLDQPYTVKNVNYNITDTLIRTYFYFDSVNCLIERGEPYDVDILQQERSRFERFIRDQGFYGFSSDYISFEVDSTVGNRQVDIYYNIRNSVTIDNFNRVTILPHPIYQIRNIYIFPDFDPGIALQQGDDYFRNLDTVAYNGYYFVVPKGRPVIRYDLILQTLYMRPGADYNLTNSDQTHSHLMSLKVYRLVNISYNEIEIPDDPLTLRRSLNCNIMLTLLVPQSYRIELEGTNSSGNIGGAVNLVYQHKNLFNGAELFSTSIRGAYEAIKQSDRLRSIQEFGAETSLRFPQFLIPFLNSEGFIRKYNPSTNIVAAYNYQAMPLFTRTLASANFGYTWKAGRYQTHIVNPLQLNLVKLPEIDPDFRRKIETSFQSFSYRDVLILGGGYSYIFNNQLIQQSKDYVFLRINLETAGNMNSLLSRVSGSKKSGPSTYMFLGQPYAQYVRGDIDVRYNFSFSDVSSIVYRGFLGIGIPYGNSQSIPFEKQYFGGGSNSLRAWQVRSIGPGSYDPTNELDSIGFLNQTGDIKIELNVEYRFKLFWIMEGALFADVGNIWTYNLDENRPGTQFSFRDKTSPETNQILAKSFYKDFAVGTGMGLRFDFKFVIGRLDVGMKLRDPRPGEGWILGSRPYRRRDFALVLGIGYPF
jgi:outer membrane protein assembly factor BamA